MSSIESITPFARSNFNLYESSVNLISQIFHLTLGLSAAGAKRKPSQPHVFLCGEPTTACYLPPVCTCYNALSGATAKPEAIYLGKNTLLDTFWNPLRANHERGMQHALRGELTMGTKNGTTELTKQHIP